MGEAASRRPISLRRWAGPAAWAAVLLAGLLVLARRPPLLAGDGIEYQANLQALYDHGTPDIRPDDLARLSRLLRADGTAPGNAVGRVVSYPAERLGDGRYVLHFWMYPLVAVPAKAALRLTGGDELAAFAVTNFALFWSAVGLGLGWGRDRPRRRLAFVGLCAVGPVLWYLPWPSPEVYTWSLVVAALVLWRLRRSGLACVCAGLGALQNPGVACVAALVVLSAVRARDLRAALRGSLGASVGLLAPAFYVAHFRDPSLHHKIGMAQPGLVSAGRVFSLVFDLNQGMAPYVPGLLLLAGFAAVQAVRARSWNGLGCAVAALAMLTICGSTPNWNCGEAWITRYAIWILPVLARLVADHPPAGRSGSLLVAAAVASHGVIASRYSSEMFYTRHTPLAAFVLRHAPALYDPEPEIFEERTTGVDGWKGELPVAYAIEAGVVTKMLVDRASLPSLARRYVVDPRYLAQITARAPRGERPYYLEPSAGAVTLRRAP